MGLAKIFGFRGRGNRELTDAIYAGIVAAARQPGLYAQMNVPDTPLGRFEMLSLHMLFFLERVEGEAGVIRDIAQDVTDGFFLDLDHSLRELGISDMGVPKRMKKLARMFYGRTKAYGDALRAGDQTALAEALKRNVRPGDAAWAEAGNLAAYALATHRHLAAIPTAAIAEGRIDFPVISAEAA